MVSLSGLAKGYEFPPVPFELSRDWVEEYRAAVEDEATAEVGDDVVPPMALVALAVRSLLEQAALPEGTIHLGQEVSFRRAVRVGEPLEAQARITSRGERQGWLLMGIELSVEDAAGWAVMHGRATITVPGA
ncbi:MAG: MaoC family dehydratase N-terminal domain-containing protein [Chloroflexi bacterium]|nr:MaoC family dehydratase N-terminal domain-containing protein [Chloroflexota bacterium]